MKKIIIYCPREYISLIQEVLGTHNYDVAFNPSSLPKQGTTPVCHYRSGELSKSSHVALITATEYGRWVEPLVSFLDSELGYTEVRLLHPGYFLHQKAFSILTSKRSQIFKRAADIFISFVLLTITFPILLMTAILIKLTSKGPIFYKQERTGLYNVPFNVCKFRSMSADAEKDGAQWARKNDNRITLIGKFIRKTRIDELPQIYNVIVGDMSIVGPRPEREVFIVELEEHIPYYRFRHALKPGITGLAQVKYAYGASIDDAIWKHKYDTYYIKYHSILMDLKILLLTIKVVIFGLGR